MVRPPPSSLATRATSFLDLTINSPNRWASSAVQRFVLAICVPSLPWAADTDAATAPALFWAEAGRGQTCSQSSAANLAATASSTTPGTGNNSWRQAPAATISLFDLGSLEPPGLFAGSEIFLGLRVYRKLRVVRSSPRWRQKTRREES